MKNIIEVNEMTKYYGDLKPYLIFHSPLRRERSYVFSVQMVQGKVR